MNRGQKMPLRSSPRLFASLLLLAGTLSIHAPVSALADDQDKMLTGYFQAGYKLEHTLQAALREFDRLDVDQNGLSPADAQIAKQGMTARRRSQKLAELMAYDLDGDLAVSRAELETAARLMQKREGCNNCLSAGANGSLSPSAAQWMKRQLQLDKNGDGSLSMDEIVAAANDRNVDQMDSRSWKSIEAIMVFDTDKNATVSEAEFEKGISDVFAAADLDHNGVIDIDEYQAARH
jgi:EF hand